MRVIQTNTTNNICQYESSYRLYGADHSLMTEVYQSKDNTHIHYCIISDNYATYWSCITCAYHQHSIEETIFVNNSQGSEQFGTISLDKESNLDINNCCIVKSNENGKGNIFCLNGGTITIKDCFLQENYLSLDDVKITGNLIVIGANSTCEYFRYTLVVLKEDDVKYAADCSVILNLMNQIIPVLILSNLLVSKK
jgi:hypothetical protein